MTFTEYLKEHDKFHEDAPYTRKDCMVCDVIFPEIERLRKEIKRYEQNSRIPPTQK